MLDLSSLDVVLAEDRKEPPSPVRSTVTTRLVIHDPGTLAQLLLPPSADAFADAYLRGDLDIEGDIATAIEAAGAMDPRRLGAAGMRRLFRWGVQLRRGTPPPRPLARVARMDGKRHSRARDMEAVRFHYDVGEAFYESWLDRRLTYSCGYFPDGTTDSDAATVLDEAQDAKLGLIAHKLRVKVGTRLLDIGSGWGSLVQFVAEQHGVEAVGVTLSQRQSDEANARFHDAGLDHLARTEVRDYRDLAALGSFDVIASVGMFEHVGQAHLPAYFGAAYEVLQPGGLFLNHGIATARRLGSRLCRGGSASPGRFVERYVFPDGEVVTIEEAVRVARRAGFEVIDVQSLRPHYALTLAAWVARLEDRWPAAVAAAGEEVARTWRLYLSAARLGFEQGSLDVYQMLLAKPVGHGVPAKLPLRPWW